MILSGYFDSFIDAYNFILNNPCDCKYCIVQFYSTFGKPEKFAVCKLI